MIVPKRRIFVNLFIAVAIAMLGVGIIAPILPLYADTFPATGVSIGLVFSSFSLFRCLLGPFIGRLSDRVGRKRILMIGLASYTLASVLYALAMSLWQLGIFRFAREAATAMVAPIAQAYIGDLTSRGKEGRTMNLFYSSMFLGDGPGTAPWRWVERVVVVGACLLRNRDPEHSRPHPGGGHSPGGSRPSRAWKKPTP